jgi:hypothetical protein
MYAYVSTPQGSIEALYLSFSKSDTKLTKEQISQMSGVDDLIFLASEIVCLKDIYNEAAKTETDPKK